MIPADLNDAPLTDDAPAPAASWAAHGPHLLTPAGDLRAVATTDDGARALARAMNLADQPVPALGHPVRTADGRIVGYGVDAQAAAWLNGRARTTHPDAELADINVQLRERCDGLRTRRDDLHQRLGEMTEARDAAQACARERAAQRDCAQRERDQLRDELLTVTADRARALADADAARADADHAHQRLGELRQQYAREAAARELADDARAQPTRLGAVAHGQALAELIRATGVRMGRRARR